MIDKLDFMSSFEYTPDDDIKVHEENAIKLLCTHFQSHESGLPEWVKNSADAYAREDAPEFKRVIVIIFDDGGDKGIPSISCLDFCGMTSTHIEQNFRVWADPDAARRNAKTEAIQGGHGNGGKCYMTQMFDKYSLLYTVKQGKRCVYGVLGGSIRFGYIPDKQSGRDVPIQDIKTELNRALSLIRRSLRVDDLPRAARRALEQADGFTLVIGVGPKNYGGRRFFQHLAEDIKNHPQMVKSLQFCKVYILLNGKQMSNYNPISLPKIEPLEGFEDPLVINIPDELQDPRSEVKVSTTENGKYPAGKLVLYTSKVSMRWNMKSRHVIIYKAQSGYIGYIPITELDVQSPHRDKIYGECQLEILERYKQNDRARLADSALTRAVNKFISDKVQEYADKIEGKFKREQGLKEVSKLKEINDFLDQWKNQLLDEFEAGFSGPSGIGLMPESSRSNELPEGEPERVELEMVYDTAGLGVSLKPKIKFLDKDGKPLRPVPFRLVSEDENVAMVDDSLNIINTVGYGRTLIYVETLDKKIRSKKAPLEVVRITNISILPEEIKLPIGSRRKLDAICQLDNHEKRKNVCLIWEVGDPNVASVSSTGMVYGHKIGKTGIMARDKTCKADMPAFIEVIPGDGQGTGNEKGRVYPRVLISGVHPDPVTGKPVNFSPDDPPVCQRPSDVDMNIWWINSSAPLARSYLESYGVGSREWRMYHVERLIEVLAQIFLKRKSDWDEMTLKSNEWLTEWGYRTAEIQKKVASELKEFIDKGVLPNG